MKESMYNFWYEYEKEDALLYNARTNALALVDAKHTKIFREFTENNRSIGDKEFLDNLKKGGYVLDDDIDELKILKSNILQSRYRSDFLSLTIAPTSNCNFRCVYCYEKESLKNSRMSEQTQDELIKFIENFLETINSLYVCWYGGEPLLVLDIIEKLSERIMKICETKKIKYSASMVTNGYLLTPDIAKKLNKYKVDSIQVTIDGPEEIHNKRRPLAGGQGTFKKILKNVKECMNDIKTINIRINTDKENMDKTNILVNELREFGINQSNVSFYLGFVESHNNCYLNEKCMTAEAFSQKHYAFMKENDINLMSAYPRLITNFCGADLKNSYVIDSEGLLYKCWNDIGIANKSVGSLRENKKQINVNYEHYFDFILYDPTEDKECRECKFLPICMGGCPFKRISKANRCVDKKYILEDFLRECAKILSEKSEINR